MSKRRTGHRAPKPSPRPSQLGQSPGPTPTGPVPWLLIKVFDGYPWGECLIDPKLVPKGVDLTGVDRDIVRVVQARYVQNPNRAGDETKDQLESDEMRVSGVPYKVPTPNETEPNQAEADSPEPTDKIEYPH